MAVNKSAVQLKLEDGTDLADKINPRFLSIKLTEKRGGEADQLNLTLHNHDGKLAPVKKGVYISLALGWETGDDVSIGLVEKGRFKVDEVERSGPPDVVVITARSADLTGNLRNRKAKIWKDTTLGAIITDIAGKNELTAQVHPDLASKPIKTIEQPAKSDIMFIRDLGKRYDAVATVKDKNLLFMPIGSETTASGKPIGAVALTRKDGWTWTFRHAQRDENDGTEAQYHDQASGKRKTVKTGGTRRKRLKKVYGSEADATEAAAAEKKRSNRGAFTFDYDLAFGDPAIIPNRKITLQGWDEEIDGIKWLVEQVDTDLDNNGLRTKLTLESTS